MVSVNWCIVRKTIVAFDRYVAVKQAWKICFVILSSRYGYLSYHCLRAQKLPLTGDRPQTWRGSVVWYQRQILERFSTWIPWKIHSLVHFSDLSLAISACTLYLANFSSEFVLYRDTKQPFTGPSNSSSLVPRFPTILQLDNVCLSLSSSALLRYDISTACNTECYFENKVPIPVYLLQTALFPVFVGQHCQLRACVSNTIRTPKKSSAKIASHLLHKPILPSLLQLSAYRFFSPPKKRNYLRKSLAVVLQDSFLNI